MATACESGGHFIFPEPVVEYEAEGPVAMRHPVFFYSELMPPGMYEMPGSFIGVYSDVLPGLDGRVIRGLENALGVRHAAFVEAFELGGEFPLLWLLECIAERKLPVMVLMPPAEGDALDKRLSEVIVETAKSLSEFPVPMFVVFYPLSADIYWDASGYIAFFRYARALFAEHAPHVAFVWSVDADKLNFMDFYPGNIAADWVGFSLFSSSTLLDLGSLIDFYRIFQHEAPIMLNLGLAHFSTEDHRYHIAETAAALETIYRAILHDFPRIKMVNYMDVCRVDYNGHDYRIRMDASLIAAYRESLGGFTAEAPRYFDDTLRTHPIRSAYEAFVEDGRVYLDTRTVTEELGKSIKSGARWVEGAMRIDASLLDIQVVMDRTVVWLTF